MKENYITISTLKKMSIENNEDEQRMTSLEIAELTGKQHKHVMEAIRKMEAGWAQVAGSNFRLGSYKAAIERHLNVNSFPTYKLFNRNGDLLDVNADPHDLEVLARLLEQMK